MLLSWAACASGCYEAHLVPNEDAGSQGDSDVARDGGRTDDAALTRDGGAMHDLGGGSVDLSVRFDMGPDAGVPLDVGVDLGAPDAGVVTDLSPPVELGAPDAGSLDLGPPDLGPPDLGPPDLGPPDVGPPDLGPPDLGAPDLGPPACPPGLSWCETACVSTLHHPSHCGQCGTVCGTGVCESGSCLHAHDVETSHDTTCAAFRGGGVQCWGRNIFGMLGDNTFVSRSRPAPVLGLEGVEVSSVAVAVQGGCALHVDGRVSCWGGRGGGWALRGDGETGERLTAAPVSFIDDAVNLDTGYNFACAVRESGELWCWGEIGYEIYGPAEMGPMRVPVRIAGVPPVTQVSATTNFVCALASDGPWCWGLNTMGKLGHGFASYAEGPAPVLGLPEPVTQVSAGADHACALGTSGTAYCWGENWFGEHGTGVNMQRSVLVPTPVMRVPRLVRVEACSYRTCAIDEAGQAWCWGENGWGILGVGDLQHRVYPTRVLGADDVVDISCEDTDMCFVLANGHVRCAGRNYEGGHGDRTTTPHRTPVDVIW